MKIKNLIPTILMLIFEVIVGVLLIVNGEKFTQVIFISFGVLLLISGLFSLIATLFGARNGGGAVNCIARHRRILYGGFRFRHGSDGFFYRDSRHHYRVQRHIEVSGILQFTSGGARHVVCGCRLDRDHHCRLPDRVQSLRRNDDDVDDTRYSDYHFRCIRRHFADHFHDRTEKDACYR